VTSHPAPTTRRRMHTRLLAAACVTLGLIASTLAGNPAAASTTLASIGCSSPTAAGASRVGRFGGIVRPLGNAVCPSGAAPAAEAPYVGTPPLVNHGGPVMSTQSTGDQVVVTPIFWAPSGYSFTSSYKSTITTYLADLAADSGKLSNVFASMFQYSGSNGAINYKMSVGTAIDDATAFPAAGCTTNSGSVYSDATGYTTCIDDDQVIAETSSVVSSHSLPSDLGHLYVMFLPKHVESCFYAGNPANQACSINPTSSAAFCAYHSAAGGGLNLVYANMPFPVYSSATGYTCTKESLGGGIQSPNGDVDADVEISPLSHEMAEAITDPRLNAWYDSTGNENGDDCAYLYGGLSGSAGAFYNQTVNGHHYLTQEEFSNKDFVAAVSGCVQGIVAVTPTVTLLSSASGPAAGGGHLTITGTGFPGASSVHFGATSATYTVLDASHIDATIPAGSGVVDVTVSTSAGTSTTSASDHYTYVAPSAPTVSAVTPTTGPTAGGQSVTITGTGFANGATVSIGGQAATGVSVDSATQITATTPAHAAGTVDVVVTTTGGTSTTSASDHYTYVAPSAPTVSAVSPTSGPTAGGQRVTITGTGFTTGATVAFGSTAGTAVTVVSPTTITVTTPKHAKGTVDVHVTTTGGASAVTTGDRYTYLARPKVTGLSRVSGTRKGGTKVTITGTGFRSGSTVRFGTARGKHVTVVSSTKIIVTSPKHAKGRVHVKVKNLGGTSAARKADRYTFT
jgi:IPT/TIG domain/Phosphate-induced protein 1 conserved region